MAERRPIREILARARAGLVRLAPAQARAEQATGALLVDVRTEAQRSRDGEVPGARRVSLNHLEWRLDPDESGCWPEAGDFGRPVIVLCNEGYCSSLAAGRLQELGYPRATDVEGGFVAWRAAGLPVDPVPA